MEPCYAIRLVNLLLRRAKKISKLEDHMVTCIAQPGAEVMLKVLKIVLWNPWLAYT